MVNILDFDPEKLNIEKICAINNELEHIYYVKYNNNSFYLVIDDLKDYFKYSKEKDTAELSSLEIKLKKRITIYYRRSKACKNL